MNRDGAKDAEGQARLWVSDHKRSRKKKSFPNALHCSTPTYLSRRPFRKPFVFQDNCRSGWTQAHVKRTADRTQARA